MLKFSFEECPTGPGGGRSQEDKHIMILTSTSIKDQAPIPVRHAFGRIDPESHVALSDNINPQLHWQDAPAGTRVLRPDLPRPGRAEPGR